MIKRCFIDVETGGFDAQKDGLIQVAGIIDFDGEIEQEFNFKMKPPEEKKISSEALKVNGLSRKQISGYEVSSKQFHLFRQMLKKYIDPYDSKDKFYFLAYNSPFDESFIRQWFLDNRDTYFGSLFWYPVIDIAGLAGEYLMKVRPTLPNFKLETVIKYLGIKPKGFLHDAMVDIEVTRELYYKLISPPDQQELFL